MDVAKFGLPSEVNVITIIIINKEIKELKGHSTKTQVKFLLSERFIQDNLESYFGKQHSRGSYSDNPTVGPYLNNCNTLRIIHELNLDVPGSNVRGIKRSSHRVMDINAPLPKRSRAPLK